MENQNPSQASPLASLNLALRSESDRAAYALKKAGTMFGCFRKGDANDPEIYVAAIAAVLSEYPESVIDFVTDPRTGLPRTCKFLPQVSEVSDACNAQMAPILAAEARRKRVAQQIAGRATPADEPTVRNTIAGGFTQLTETLRSRIDEATGERIAPPTEEENAA